MLQQRPIFSAGCYVVEPPDTWTSRLSGSELAGKVPHLVEGPEADMWVVGDLEMPLSEATAAGAFTPNGADGVARWADMPPAAHLPSERLRAMDAGGIEYAVLYPMMAGQAGERLASIRDDQLELACVRAYNDWLIQEWGTASERFIPQCLVPLGSPEAAATEIRRAVASGHRGVIMPPLPMYVRDLPHINTEYYDPLWSACEELGVPVCFHCGVTSRIQFPAYAGLSDELASAVAAVTGPASGVQILTNFLFSPIPKRHPNLKVVFAESSLAWAAYILETADHQHERQRLHQEGFELTMSEVFRRHCYLTGWYDTEALALRQYLGIENILWQSALPKRTSMWPSVGEGLQRSVAGIDPSDERRVRFDNGAELYQVA